MNLKEAQDEAQSRWGEYGVAMIDGSMRHEVGFFDGDNVVSAGFVRLGCGNTFEEAFQESEGEAAQKSEILFYPGGAESLQWRKERKGGPEQV